MIVTHCLISGVLLNAFTSACKPNVLKCQSSKVSSVNILIETESFGDLWHVMDLFVMKFKNYIDNSVPVGFLQTRKHCSEDFTSPACKTDFERFLGSGWSETGFNDGVKYVFTSLHFGLPQVWYSIDKALTAAGNTNKGGHPLLVFFTNGEDQEKAAQDKKDAIAQMIKKKNAKFVLVHRNSSSNFDSFLPLIQDTEKDLISEVMEDESALSEELIKKIVKTGCM